MKKHTTAAKAQTAAAVSPMAAIPEAPAAAGAGELVDMEAAISHLKTTRPTFYRWLRAGKLKGMKVGRQWRFYRTDLDRFLKGEGPQIELSADINPFLLTLADRLRELGAPEHAQPVPANCTAEQKVITAINAMLLVAYRMRATDIHFFQRNPAAVSDGMTGVFQCRVDGKLLPVAMLDGRLTPPILERFKLMAGCDLHEKARPQDGRMQLVIEGKRLDMRVSFVPTITGEAVTFRLLDAKAAALELNSISFSAADRERVDRALAAPNGLILFTGPTGSGKTTVQYACLNAVAKRETCKIMTVEDPVEYILENTVQIPVNVAAGLTFTAALRAILRSDPDVVMTTEIRDRETLQVLLQTALTGHLVMSSLHAEDATIAVQRLLDIGSEPFIVADTLRLIVSQRLVRKLCTACSEAITPCREELAKAAAVARQGGLDWSSLEHKFRKAVGCPKCAMTGYRGRTIIAETLEMTPELDRAIRTGVEPANLRRLAVEQGMTTLAADGIRRYAAGETTLSEVLRVARIC